MMSSLFSLRIRHIVVAAAINFVAIVTMCAQAQTARVTVEPSIPTAYTPFNVRVTFASEVCFSVTSPVYSSVTFQNSVLSLSLSHLKSGPCVTERLLPVSGLPAGTHTVRVSVTSSNAKATDYGFSTIETEIASTAVTVKLPPQLVPVNVFTGRINGDNIFRPFPYTEGGGGPVVLWIPQGGVLNGVGYWLQPGDPPLNGYTFSAMRDSSATPGVLPSAYEPFYFFGYPAPAVGVFGATTAECLQIVRTWGAAPNANVCPTPIYYVLKYKNGACPLGATPVFRLFHPASVVHRYTQSAETYSELQNFGFIGDGPVFCAPIRA